MTHEYTLLLGGQVVRGSGQPYASAVAWAADTVLAVGSDAEVRAISRGDSHFVDLAGASVVALAVDGSLEIGSPADLAILRGSPGALHRDPTGRWLDGALAIVRGGRVVAGSLRDIGVRLGRTG